MTLPGGKPVSDRFILKVVSVLALAWGMWQATWTIEERFVTRREFSQLVEDVKAIRAHIDAHGLPGDTLK